nr:4092_t:CDS:2 [Entrophospora candida]
MSTSIPLFTLNNNVQIPALGLGTFRAKNCEVLDVAIKTAALTGYRLIGLKPEDPMNETNRQGSWEALEKLYSEGKVRSIGVCNYTKKHLTHLLANCKVVPAVHQFELHPLLYQDEQKEIIELTKKHNIRVEAYSSLGEGQLVNGKIKIPIIKEIADKHKVTEAQVLLRWGYQHDAIVIPKSVTPERIKVNSEIFHFELSKEDMESLNALSKTRKKRFCWDPTNIY